jgi:hypothetical protein
MEQHAGKPCSRRPGTVEDRRVMRIPTPSTPLNIQEGLDLTDSETAEDLAGSLEAQFPPVNDPSVLAVIEVVDARILFSTASKTNLTNPTTFKTLFGVSKSARHEVHTLFPIWL